MDNKISLLKISDSSTVMNLTVELKTNYAVSNVNIWDGIEDKSKAYNVVYTPDTSKTSFNIEYRNKAKYIGLFIVEVTFKDTSVSPASDIVIKGVVTNLELYYEYVLNLLLSKKSDCGLIVKNTCCG